MIRVGTRSSRLARAQTARVCEALAEEGHETDVRTTETLGDRNRSMPVEELGVAGAFTAGLARGLQADEIDLAVHSLKDLPVGQPDGLTLAAILERGPAADALLVRDDAHAPAREPPLADGARVATSGPRRQSQLAAAREDLAIVDVRGNVDTRVAKLRAGWFDALVTAHVALERIDVDLDGIHVVELDPEAFPPAPGQAAIAVQARKDSPAAEAAAALDDPDTRQAVQAERRLLAELGGGCGLPLGAWAHREADGWQLHATFAGHGWDPSHAGHVHRSRTRTADPRAGLGSVLDELADAEPQPRQPSLEQAPDPAGEPVLVVASEPTARRWAAMLREGGLAAEPVPTRRFTPAETDSSPPTEEAGWLVVTSRQAARPLARSLDDPLEANVAAVGPGTARALQAEGLPCHLIGDQARGESLAARLEAIDAEDPIVLVQGDLAYGKAAARLAEAGFHVDRWQAYTTDELGLDLDRVDAELPACAALVMSPRNAATLADHDAGDLARSFVAIGPSTAQTLEQLGLDPTQAPAPRPEPVREVIAS